MVQRQHRTAENPIELAVVGAHLRGLPLNHELTDCGAVYVRSARTKPVYRLFWLPDAKHLRPGLVRVTAPPGFAIEVEIWALSTSAFGNFVARVAPPLTIGTIALEDSNPTKGFLCEAYAVAEAEDISSFGGWRGFIACQKLVL